MKEEVSMKKIKDRVTLGIISGLIGNVAKELTAAFLIRNMKMGTRNGPTYAAGIFFPKRTMLFRKSSKKVKLVGYVTDNIIGAILGVSAVYVLSFTGKDNYIAKGIGLGHFTWTTLYGFIAKMGATSQYPAGVDNNINYLINHSVFGVITKIAAVKLGDEGLFKPNLKSLGKPEAEVNF